MPRPGEFDFIAWIRSQYARFDHVLLGPGDDLAILQWKPSDDLLLVGVDQVLEGVHFDSSIHSPLDIGRKVMNRNLSDCAAMACLPAAAVATVALPRERDMEYAKQLFAGMQSAAAVFEFPVVGGDTGSWDGKLVLTVTILGRSAGIAPVRRSGANPGDGIYVTGPLGGSILGRHMNFVPKVKQGRLLGEGGASAMIDLSDGLSRDLAHVCHESEVGARVLAEAIPVHEDAIEMRRTDGRSPLEHALNDGEDYELLFTAPANHPAAGLGILIGTITREREILLNYPDGRTEPLQPKGWEHRL
jgi:thiamine-monophosphate kinase